MQSKATLFIEGDTGVYVMEVDGLQMHFKQDTFRLDPSTIIPVHRRATFTGSSSQPIRYTPHAETYTITTTIGDKVYKGVLYPVDA